MRPRTQDGGGRGVGIRTGGGPNPACAYRRGRDGPGIQDPAARRTWSPVRPHAPSFSPNFLLATSYRSYLISLQRLYTAQSCGTAHSSCLVPLVLLNHDPTSPSACPSSTFTVPHNVTEMPPSLVQEHRGHRRPEPAPAFHSHR